MGEIYRFSCLREFICEGEGVIETRDFRVMVRVGSRCRVLVVRYTTPSSDPLPFPGLHQRLQSVIIQRLVLHQVDYTEPHFLSLLPANHREVVPLRIPLRLGVVVQPQFIVIFVYLPDSHHHCSR